MNAFLNACGATGPLVLSTDSAGGGAGDSRAFDLPFVIIGRDPRCDLRFSRLEVCERHAYLQLVEGRVFCIDLGSRVGVSHSGKSRKVGRLDRDRPVRIGPYRIRLLAGDRDAPLEDPFEPDDRRTPLELELRHRSVRRTNCSLQGALALIGSGSDCQVRLIDPSVSHYHACLVRTLKEVWIVDLLGEGGVKVNDIEVSHAPILPGDTIQVGRSLIVRTAIETVSTTDIVAPAVLAPSIGSSNGTHHFDMNVLSNGHGVSHENGRVETAVACGCESPKLSAPAETSAVVETHGASRELMKETAAPLMDEVRLMQRQMIDEFRQARTMMVESFATLQQEQWALLNHELEQLGHLGEQLKRVREEIQHQSEMVKEQTRDAITPVQTRLGSASASPATVPISLTPSATENGEPHSRTWMVPVGPVIYTKSNQEVVVSSSREIDSPRPELRLAATGDPLLNHDRDAHLRLFERIMQLEEKRQGGWKRWLGLLPGEDEPKPSA